MVFLSQQGEGCPCEYGLCKRDSALLPNQSVPDISLTSPGNEICAPNHLRDSPKAEEMGSVPVTLPPACGATGPPQAARWGCSHAGSIPQPHGTAQHRSPLLLSPAANYNWKAEFQVCS